MGTRDNKLEVDLINIAVLTEYSLFRLTSPEYISHKRLVQYAANERSSDIITAKDVSEIFWHGQSHITTLLSQLTQTGILERMGRPNTYKITEQGQADFLSFEEKIKNNYNLISKINAKNLYNTLLMFTVPFYAYQDKPKLIDLVFNAANVLSLAERGLYKSEKKMSLYMVLSKTSILNEFNVTSTFINLQKTIPSKSYFNIADISKKAVSAELIDKRGDELFITKSGKEILTNIEDRANEKFNEYLKDNKDLEQLIVKGISAIQTFVPKLIKEDYNRLLSLNKQDSYKWPRRGNLTDTE